MSSNLKRHKEFSSALSRRSFTELANIHSRNFLPWCSLTVLREKVCCLCQLGYRGIFASLRFITLILYQIFYNFQIPNFIQIIAMVRLRIHKSFKITPTFDQSLEQQSIIVITTQAAIIIYQQIIL